MSELKIIEKDSRYAHNRYCGPCALSAILGISTGQAAAEIRKIRGYKKVTGTVPYDLEAVLYEKNIKLEAIKKPKGRGITIKKWMEDTKEERGDKLYLLAASRHWIVIKGDKMICGLMMREMTISDTKPESKYEGDIALIKNLARTLTKINDRIFEVKDRKGEIDNRLEELKKLNALRERLER